MNDNIKSYIMIGVILLVVILLIISIVKKAIKLLIFAIIILVIYSGYSVLVKKVSPIELLSGYKTNIEYGKSITDYTIKIKTSLEDLKSAANINTIDQESINRIKNDDINLNKYLNDVQILKHTDSLNGFHKSYISSLKNLVSMADTTFKVVGNKDIGKVKDMVTQLNVGMETLDELKNNIK